MLALATTVTPLRAHAGLKTRVRASTCLRATRVGKFRAQLSKRTREIATRRRRLATGSRKYLSREPLLESPAFVSGNARTGASTPAYAYAANNPMAFVDLDGRTTMARFLDPNVAYALAEGGIIIGGGLVAVGAASAKSCSSSSPKLPDPFVLIFGATTTATTLAAMIGPNGLPYPVTGVPAPKPGEEPHPDHRTNYCRNLALEWIIECPIPLKTMEECTLRAVMCYDACVGGVPDYPELCTVNATVGL